MRSKQAFRNVLSSIILQFIIAITGIYIPQLMISTYGSSINGIVASISQFITYFGLVEAGIGNASIVALYTPLANKDVIGINGVMSAAKKFYQKSGIAFLFLLLLLTLFYPILSGNGFSVHTVRWMILILGSSALIDYLFLGKYRVLLTANQKGYIITITQSVGTILNSLICIILILCNCNILFVKAVATFVYVLRSVFIYFYVKKYYPYLNFKERPNTEALKQKWDVLVHQVAGVIVSSTDVVALTIVLKNFVEISVYTTYNLISSNVISLIDSFSNGLCAGFGETFAKNEKKLAYQSYLTYEYLYFIVIFSGCTCLGMLFIPFMKLYTANITDANYIRPFTAFLFVIITISRGIRTPALTMIMAVGHYKETRNSAVIEATLNVCVSLLLVRKWGINGVLIGTVCSYMYRTLDIIIYVERQIFRGTIKSTVVRIIRNICVLSIVSICVSYMNIIIESWIELVLYAVGLASITVFLFVIINGIAEPLQVKNVLGLVKRIYKR